jgi:hypothetical protein
MYLLKEPLKKNVNLKSCYRAFVPTNFVKLNRYPFLHKNITTSTAVKVNFSRSSPHSTEHISYISLTSHQIFSQIDLVQALRKKRPYLVANLDQVILHQDNAPAHTSQKTQLELDLLGFECLKHPPYSPDLTPMDFAVLNTFFYYVYYISLNLQRK